MPTTTARLALPTPLLTEAADVPASMLALAAALDFCAQWAQGPLASRPAATGTTGRLYFGTDTGHFYVNTGTVWVDIGPSVLAADSVGSTEIAPNSVGLSELADGAVDTAAIVDGAVTTNKHADASITSAKIAAALKASGGAGSSVEALRALGSGAADAMPGNQIIPSGQIADNSITAAKVNTALKPSSGAAAGTEALRALGTTAGTAAAGDDPRFLGATTINFQGGAYRLVLTDRGKMIDMSGGSTLFVPVDATGFVVGDFVHVMQTGAGQVNLQGDGGVTVYGNPGLKLAGQFATATLMKRAANQWVAFGGLTT